MVDLTKISTDWTILDLIRNPNNYSTIQKNFNLRLAKMILERHNLLPKIATI